MSSDDKARREVQETGGVEKVRESVWFVEEKLATYTRGLSWCIYLRPYADC